MAKRPVVLIAGIAEGLGAAQAEAFAAAGHDVLGLARSERSKALIAGRVEAAGGAYAHALCDLADAGQVAAVIRGWEERVAVLIHNAQAFFMAPFERTTPADFEHVWRMGCLGAAVIASRLLPEMAARGRGAALFSGATASLRGGPSFAAFASAKFALRGLAQALAREYAPSGVHVAHVVIDGLIEGPKTDARFGPAVSGRMDAAALARTYLHLALQERSAWTHEVDLRPAGEKF